MNSRHTLKASVMSLLYVAGVCRQSTTQTVIGRTVICVHILTAVKTSQLTVLTERYSRNCRKFARYR